MKRTFWPVALVLLLLLVWWLYPSVSSAPKTPAPKKQLAASMRSSLPKRNASYTPPEGDIDADPLGTLRLEGQVLDEQGNGVSGISVAISTAPKQSTTSGEDGFFSFDGLLERSYYLAALDKSLRAEARVDLKKGSPLVILQLTRTKDIALRVLDGQTRSPIVGAKISESGLFPLETRTDAEGRAVLQGITSDWFWLLVQAEGYTPLQNGFQRRAPEVMILLTPGVAVSGLVLDPEGNPIAGAEITANGQESTFYDFEGDDAQKITSDAEGKWRLPALGAGTFHFRARHTEHASGISEAVVLDGKTPAEGVVIRLQEGAALSGRVVDLNGAPVAGAMVAIEQEKQRGFSWVPLRYIKSDEQGNFQGKGLPKAQLHMMARKDELSSKEELIDLSSGKASGIELLIEELGTISGVVVTTRGEPVPNAEIYAYTKDYGTNQTFWRLRGGVQTTSKEDGSFIIRGIPFDATMNLTASAEGLVMDYTKATEAKVGAQDVRIEMSAYASVKGRVTRKDGSAPPSYEVNVGGASKSFSEADGSFLLEKLSTGKSRVLVYGDTFRVKKHGSVILKEGETTDLGVIVVEDGRRIRGHVYDEQGAPLGGASVGAVEYVDGTASSVNALADQGGTLSKEDGSYELLGLGEEALFVIAEHPIKGRSEPVSVSASSENLSLDLVIKATGVIEGVVTSEGKPVASGVSAHFEGQVGRSGFFVRSDEKGFYRFDRLAAGSYIVDAEILEEEELEITGGQRSVTVKVSSGETTTRNIDIPKGVMVRIQIVEGGKPITNVTAYLLMDAILANTEEQLEAAIVPLPPERARRGSLSEYDPAKSDTIYFGGTQPGEYTLCIKRYPLTKDQPVNEDDDDDDEARRGTVGCQTISVMPATAEQRFSVNAPPL